jgi:hypothetical protein
VAIDEKLGVREIVSLSELPKKLSCWAGAAPFEEVDAEEWFRVDVYCRM